MAFARAAKPARSERALLSSAADATEQVNQRLIRLESFGRKARESAAEVVAGECRIFFDRSVRNPLPRGL